MDLFRMLTSDTTLNENDQQKSLQLEQNKEVLEEIKNLQTGFTFDLLLSVVEKYMSITDLKSKLNYE